MLRQRFFLLQKLHIADNGGERRLDVMGDVGNQLHFHTLAFHLLVHRGSKSLTDVLQSAHGFAQIMCCIGFFVVCAVCLLRPDRREPVGMK